MTHKYGVIFLVVGLCVHNYVWSKPNYESLLNKVSSASPEEKPIIFLQLAQIIVEKDQKQALDFAKKVVFWGKKVSNIDVQADAYHFMGTLHQSKNELKQAINCYKHEVNFREQRPASVHLVKLYSLLAKHYLSDNKKRKSNSYFVKSLETAKKLKSDPLIIQNYEALFLLNYDRKKYQDALEYFRAYLKMRDSIKKREAKNEIAFIVSGFITKAKKKDHRIDTLIQARDTLIQVSDEQNSKIKELASVVQEKNLAIIQKEFEEIILGFGIFGISLLVFLLYKLYSSKKTSNIQLLLKKEEIQYQKEEILIQHNEIELKKTIIEEKNEKITSSIQYAKTIQKSLFPTKEKIKQFFPNSFVFYKPKDIVGGDFYWLNSTKNNKVYLAVGDCTGHGVPGGFLTMMGIEKLNTIFNTSEQVRLNPALMLKILNAEFQTSFNLSDQQRGAADGMDIAICEFDMNNGKIIFSGANRPLWLVKRQDGSLVEYMPTKKGMGEHFENNTPYQNHELETSSGDMIYIFSDGYESQFGGSQNRKLMKKNLKKLLISLRLKDAQYQKEFIHAFFNTWKKEEEQTDDVLVVGIRVP